ncbi:DUF2267 domain-containing protein [Geobacter sp. DSM 9736]|uniref:DUF2267 domain-containing protein n=1 Tax=Geobacter sp. DSM 9736 TaxID=1277350 RepID=UPI000B50D468|nr:DUF2267 domain-containing protein [Geobacter sp. DSM 9736]SNB46300.1 Uncharacterized conserved protein, DUF2267 family [Geobacter sp. DSM 9736]
MEYTEFMKLVQQEIGVKDTEKALRAVQATLETLGERLFHGEAEQLAAQLPQELQPFLVDIQEHRKFGVEDFLQMVGEREGIDGKEAEAHARAVISVLTRAVTPGEIQDVVSQLPEGFRKLFGEESKTVH